MKTAVPASLVVIALCILVSLLGACTSEQVVRANAPPATRAQQPVAEAQLLNVGIAIFDPGLPEDRRVDRGSGDYPTLRKAEARYLSYTLKTALDQSGQWGAVHLVPDQQQIIDVLVTGRIVESSGSELILAIEVKDATGRQWLSEEYPGMASKYAYTDDHFSKQDPFQAVYNSVANDILAVREHWDDDALESIRRIAELRFARDMSPDRFADYVHEESPGRYSLNRLPADDDPMLKRTRRIRERDFMLLDTLDGYYAAFHQDMKPAYREWRKINYDESVEMKKLQRSARNRMAMGAAALVAGAAGAVKSDGTAGQAVSAGTAVGGAVVFASGVKKYQQAEIHVEALRELNESFESDMAPKVISLEDSAITLTGSAEMQYRKWRQHLREIYRQETGLPR